MTESTEFVLSWDIDVEAESPEAAVLQALEIMQEQEAHVFLVRNEKTGETQHYIVPRNAVSPSEVSVFAW